jgi:hypothetical protein
MRKHSWGAVCFLVAWLGISSASHGFFTQADMNVLGDEFLTENKKFEGNWEFYKSYRKGFCPKYYWYGAHVEAALKDVDFQLQEDGSMVVGASIENLYGKVSAEYESMGTFCVPLSAWLGAGSDLAKIRARAVFDEGSELKSVKVEQTVLSTLHLGFFVPHTIENLATDLVNRALTYVWESRLGDWLNVKITKLVKEKLNHKTE